MAITPLNTKSMGLRPKPQRAAFLHHLIRDQFTLSTWILLGAAIQGTLLLLPLRPTYVIGPSFALLALKLIDTICVTLGWRRNAYLDGTIGSKFSTLLPQPDGTFGSARQTANPDDGKVAVLLLGFRTNHPLGPLSPGARETGAYFTTMNKHLESNASTNGFLGSTAYLGTGRTTKSEIMTTFYFRSLADIETFAHGPVHREGWDWWNKTVKEHRHLGISHEVYEAPRGKWETVYMNYHKTGMGATVHHVEDGKGEGKWVEPLVDAVKGPLSTHKGRTSV